MHKAWLFFYPLVLFLYGIYSYSQVTPNLVLSSNPQFWQFQQTMWQLGYHQRTISTVLFVLCVLASFLAYGLIMQRIKQAKVTKKLFMLQFALCVAALLPSYPALSNDIFNYLMNAKMMHVYEASPYTHAAWDFPQEPWLSFMMNIHTTTPYGYVWTGLGYVLYILALGDLQLGMMLFRLLAVFSVAAIGWSIWEISAKDRRMLFAGYFMFNPLVMLEAINNTHNDITMMAFLLVGLALFFRYRQKNKLQASILLLVGWLLSVHTKLVTVVLPAVVALYYVLRKKIPWFNAADYGAWLLIVAMFADGSKRFFSWYLLWAFSLSALAQSKFTKQILFLFSFTGMLSYVFFISSGEYSKEQGLLRIGLLFSLPIIFLLFKSLGFIKPMLLFLKKD
jgi:hypothetical protein